MADKVAYFNVSTTIRGLNTQNGFSIDIGLVFLHKVYLTTHSMQLNVSNPVTFGPQFSDLIEQVRLH